MDVCLFVFVVINTDTADNLLKDRRLRTLSAEIIYKHISFTNLFSIQYFLIFRHFSAYLISKQFCKCRKLLKLLSQFKYTYLLKNLFYASFN